MPILVIDGEQLNDSTAIMTLLTSKLPQSGWRKGSGPFKSAEEEQWFKCASPPPLNGLSGAS